MVIEQVNKSFILHDYNYNTLIQEYYNYSVNLLKAWLAKNNISINVIIGNYNHNFNNTNRTIKIDIQCEHTLVKIGGRSVHQLIYGNVPCDNGTYLIRVDNFNYYNNLDYIIEYSLPNMYNLSTNDMFKEYLDKNIYISPLLFSPNFIDQGRKNIITMFTDNSNQRRSEILNCLKQLSIEFTSISNCYTNDCLYDVYKNAKVLVNVHQTDHHHTFEELRVLPALLSGVIVVSEDVPLKEKIPYSEYIVWSSYDNIAQTVKDVSDNYEYYFNKIFTDSKLKEIIKGMQDLNLKCFDKLLQ